MTDERLAYRPVLVTAESQEQNDLFCNAVAKIRAASVTLEDQRYMLENLCGLIASGRLDTKSLAFKKISTIVRSKLSPPELICLKDRYTNEGLEPINKKRIMINFPEQKLEISEEEHDLYKPSKKEEYFLRLITGTHQEHKAQRSLIKKDTRTDHGTSPKQTNISKEDY